MKIKIVYLATPEIAVNSLQKLSEYENIEIQAIVTMPDRPAGRGCKIQEPPIKIKAKELGIKIYQTPSISKDREILEEIKNLKPDFLITFAFGQLLSQEVLDIPKYCVINLHASLLPKYRGANPIQWCIVNGDNETGITTMRTVKKMDAGDICLTDKISIGENTTVPMLTEEISQKAPVLIHKTLTQIVAGQLEFIQQEENDVTFAPKFVKEDGLIDFSLTAEEIHNKVRGLQPWPNAYINRNGKNIQILETEVNRDIELTDKIGEIISISRDGVVVNCKNSAITIKTVKPESKGMMRASDFINGKRLKEGEIL